MARRLIFLIAALALLAPTAQAKVVEAVASGYAKVSFEIPGGRPPGELGKALVYVDGPVMFWRGSWKHPEQTPPGHSPVPDLLVPVRVVLPGVYKFFDLDATESVSGEIRPETYTPEARIYRVLLPIRAMQSVHKFQVLFHAGLKAPFNIKVVFQPPVGLVVRNAECVRQGLSLDSSFEAKGEDARLAEPPRKQLGRKQLGQKANIENEDENAARLEEEAAKAEPAALARVLPDTNLVYLFCATRGEKIDIGVYAPMDRNWTRFGFDAVKTFEDRGLFFKVPVPPRGQFVPETITEFELESNRGKTYLYTLRHNPPWRPRYFSARLSLAPSYHHFEENRAHIELDQFSVSGKFEFQFKLFLFKWFEGYTDIFGTIHDITHNPSGENLPGFLYWGADLRLGYVSPTGPQYNEWTFMTGWYWWRFYVAGEKYGVNNKLGGPQLFAQYRWRPVHGRMWWANARIALVGPSVYPRNFRSYELSAAYGSEFLWIDSRRPLSVVVELSRLHVERENVSNNLFNGMVGLSYPLY